VGAKGRREFLRAAGVLAGAATVAPNALTRAVALTRDRAGRAPVRVADSVLDAGASEAPFDTVVVVVMENRSFDHFFGWLGTDPAYLAAGQARYGAGFRIDGRQDLTYRDENGQEVATYWLLGAGGSQYPYQGCGAGIPGHGWDAGRAQLTRGFLGRGAGNSPYALGYYRAPDMPFLASLTTRYTTCDRYFSSLLGPTFPNRQYVYAAQSSGARNDPGPLKPGIFGPTTIWDRLRAAHVPVGYYYTDLPILPLFGRRFFDVSHPLDAYLEDAANGDLPNFVMVDPGFRIAQRTDDHPVGDIRTGQRWIRAVFQAFAQSPQWERGLFVLTYDEWGGFFDHVRPPVVPDSRRTSDLATDFGQLGFRVPTVVASPYARPGFADHTRYDHSSIIRMLEWRFLGAPARGPRSRGKSPWWLTDRDRHANNLGSSLTTSGDPEHGFDLAMPLAAGAQPCDFGALGGPAVGDPFQNVTQQMEDLTEHRFPTADSSLWNAS
jgi:phospholipase C